MTSFPPRVSVAMCTFNGAKYLRDQLVSIFQQTRPVDEIVIGDDGSTDETLEILHDCKAQAGSVAFRILPPIGRLGVTANFERTLSACSGGLIALCDQDDVWEGNRVEIQVAEMDKRGDLSVLFSDALLVDADGASLSRSVFNSIGFRRSERLAIKSGHAFDVLLRRNLATGATVMVRQDLLAVSSPFPPEWVHDEWLAVMGAATMQVDFVDRPLVRYRQHAGNEIGASNPTLGFRVSRVLEQRGDRNATLARKFAVLSEHLDRLGSLVSDRDRELAKRKAAFERRRAGMPAGRRGRIGAVIREMARGEYAEFSSQGRLDILRDLLQPAQTMIS